MTALGPGPGSATRLDVSVPVRLAVIGAGFIGKKHIQTIAAQSGADLVAISDIAPDAADIADQYGVPFHTDVRDMLASVKPDGVVVCTPTVLHLEPTLAALEAGAHVLLEKPIASSLEDARAIVAGAEQADRSVLVGHHRRFNPTLARARDIVSGGDIGSLVLVNGQWSVKKHEGYFSPSWRKERAAGPVLTNLVHEIDTIRFVCGEIRSISAEVSNTVHGFEKEDSAAVVMTFESGALGAFTISDSAPSPWSWEQATGENPVFPVAGQNTHRFTGSEAALEFPRLTLWRHENSSASWHDPINHVALDEDHGDPFTSQCEHFIAVVRGDDAPLISADDGTRSLAATLAVFEAAETGARVLL